MRLPVAQASLSLCLILAACSADQGANGPAAIAPAPQEAPVFPEREVFFGDLHLHTSYSLDAAGEFNVSTTPEQAGS